MTPPPELLRLTFLLVLRLRPGDAWRGRRREMSAQPAAVALVLGAIAMGASYITARRACRVYPMQASRME